MQELQPSNAGAELAPVVDRLEQLEGEMLSMEQAECPVNHHFGPGLCIVELSMAAGTRALGNHQKFDHQNVLLKGAVEMINEDGTSTVLRAPLIFVGKPGRKVGIVLEDMVWLNIYATDLKDVDAVEDFFIAKSPTWIAMEAERQERLRVEREVDRLDYRAMLAEGGIPESQARAQSVHLLDQTQMPASGANVRIRPSSIEGQGLFVNESVEPFHVIAPAVIDGMRTPAGRYTNHGNTPNACMVRRLDGGVDLVSIERIRGTVGGQAGDEVTIDYRQAMALMAATGKRGIA